MTAHELARLLLACPDGPVELDAGRLLAERPGREPGEVVFGVVAELEADDGTRLTPGTPWRVCRYCNGHSCGMCD